MVFFRKFTFNHITVFILSLGCLLRLIQFAYNRSLWGDEAALALKIISSPLLELIIYSQGQVAPPLFMLLLKVWTNIFGTSDLVFRCIPLFCGIGSLFLFNVITPYFLNKKGCLYALLLFSLLDNLIYYSSELKQYSTELFSTLIIIWVYLRFKHLHPKKRFSLLAITGSILLFSSHSVLFFIATIGVILLFESFKHKQHTRAIFFTITTWFVTFVSIYYLTTKHIHQSEGLKIWWKSAFMPLIPLSLSDLLWYPINLLRFCCYFLGLRLTLISNYIDQLLSLPFDQQIDLIIQYGYIFGYIFILGTYIGFLYLCGIRYFYQHNKHNAFLLLGPIVLTLIASGLEKYPFQGRLLLFYFPYMVIVVIGGLIFAQKKISHLTINHQIKSVMTMILFTLLFLHPISSATYHIFYPRSLDSSKQILRHLAPLNLPIIVTNGPNSLSYYCKQRNYPYMYLSIPPNDKSLNSTSLNTLTKSDGVIAIAYRDKTSHDNAIAYFYNHFAISKHVIITNKASILYLDL